MGDADGGEGVARRKSGLPGGVAVSPKELSEPRRLKLNTSSENAAGASMRCWLSQADTWIDGGGACGCQTFCEVTDPLSFGLRYNVECTNRITLRDTWYIDGCE